MNLKCRLSFLFIFFTLILFGQNDISILVKDNHSKEIVFGAKTMISGLISDNRPNAGFTNVDGIVKLSDIPNGKQEIVISYRGYNSRSVEISFPRLDTSQLTVYLEPIDQELEEIIIEATRANKSISNLPTRTEVLTEEIDEAASMEPSRIAHLITHSTGIQVQTTSASSNGAVVRIQGLNGRYTQILKDGFPLYGGFSGSLDILQIPPLDLRQVEYIKGSASTLYGGGAIGGVVNLVSKKPSNDVLLHTNMSHIGARDFNAFIGKKMNKFGFTTLASLYLHNPFDVNNDNYTEIPKTVKVNFNPKLFFYPDNKTEFMFGAFIGNEDRMGGDISLVRNQNADSTHFYFDSQTSSRVSTQFLASRDFNKSNSLKLKNSISSFDRQIKLRENINGSITSFFGRQFNTFSELNYNLRKERHDLNIGLNIYSDRFEEEEMDTPSLRNQQILTLGGYANHLWDIHEKFAVESGFRADYAIAETINTENGGDLFILPRLSTLYKASKQVSFRLGGGLGYRMPSIFNEESEPYGFKNILPIDFSNVEAEKSYGANFDFKYQSTFGSENVLLTFNQMFFYNFIDKTIQLNVDSIGFLYYVNSNEALNTRGFETQLKLTVWKFTWFLGYTYTDAFYVDGSSARNMTLTPQHSIKGDLLFVVENKWRIGLDYEYKSEQYLSNGTRSPSLFTTGIVVERRIQNFVLFLNAENFTDTRQSNYGSMLSGPNNTPQFTEIWAPQEGFYFNGGLKIDL